MRLWQLWTLFGIPGMNTGAGLPGPPVTGGLSSFFFDGNVQLGADRLNSDFGDGLNVGRCNCPLTERENEWQGVNNWSKMLGNHTIKFGADIRYATNLRVPSDSNRTGQMNFYTNDDQQQWHRRSQRSPPSSSATSASSQRFYSTSL